MPLALEALEGVRATILERETRGTGERARQVRDQDLVRASRSRDPGRFVDRHSANVVTHQLDFSDVDTRSDEELLVARPVPDGVGAAQGSCGSVEGREQPVSRRLHLPAAEALELGSNSLEVTREMLAPLDVAEFGGDRGGVHEVGEENRGENAVADSRRKAGKEGTKARPLDLHARLVPDREAVVARGDIHDVQRSELERRSVRILDPESTRENDADVTDLAPLSPHPGAHVLRPAPSGLRDDLTHGEVPELDETRPQPGSVDLVVWILEAPEAGVGQCSD